MLLTGVVAEVALMLAAEFGDEIELVNADVAELLARTEDSRDEDGPLVAVIGRKVPAPVGLVHALRPDGMNLGVILLSTPATEAKAALLPLLFSTDQARHVPSAFNDRLPAVIREMAEAMARRSAYSAVRAAAQRRLTGSPAIGRHVDDRLFGRLLAQAPIAAVTLDGAGGLAGWNHKAADLLDLGEPASLRLRFTALFDRRADLEAHLAAPTDPEATFERTRPDGTLQALRLAPQRVTDANGTERTLVLVEDVTDRVRTQRQLAERTRQALLTADVAAAMTAPGDLSHHLQRCARAIADHLDATCVHVWTVGSRPGRLVPSATAGSCLDGEGPHAAVPFDESTAKAIAEQRRPRLGHGTGAEGFAGYPLVFGDELMGVLGVATADQLSSNALAMLEGIADQIAVGIRQDLLLRRLRSTAEALQRPLLPPRLPSLPGFDIAGRYHPGAGGQIGGDFYDAFTVPDGRHVLVLGDVCGKGPTAAAVTGLVRHTLWTAAQHAPEPDRVLSLVNQALLRQDSPFCTLAYAVVDPSCTPARLRLALAGHPPPVLRRADGRTDLLSTNGPLLGVMENVTHGVVEVELHPGDTLVLYTDGFTEGAGGYHQREPDDIAALAAAHPLQPGTDTPADGIAAALLAQIHEWWGERLRDDLAVLALTALPVRRPDHHDFDLTTDTPPLSQVRSRTRELLDDLDPDVVVDVELVITELVANAYEHASGPRALRLRHVRGEPLLRVEVDDATPGTLPKVGSSSIGAFRGRGLAMVETMAVNWGVRDNGGHKTVWADIPTTVQG